MTKALLVILTIAVSAAVAVSQSKSNEVIAQQITDLRAGKSITVNYDKAGNTSKLLAVAENFSDREAQSSGLMAMNFAAGLFYAGSALERPPEKFLLSFWAMGRTARFAENQTFRIFAGQAILEIGSGRYSARPRENMEYLNYELSRADLVKIARASNVKMSLGRYEFTFTPSQLKMLADLLVITDTVAAR